jgi:hypothetical protein
MRVADKTAVSLLRMIFGRLQQEDFFVCWISSPIQKALGFACL